MARLAGKRIFMTAAAQGMGRAAALAMAKEGAHVVATDIREDLLANLSAESLAQGGKAIETYKLDATDSGALAKMVSEQPALNVLFNCAGWVHQGDIFHCDEADLDRSYAINVKPMFVSIKAALPKIG
jgi:2-keto-3-deoxy-L-fuconate dehydrogenase